MTFYLGIDAGGSNCRCRLVDAQGAVLAEAKGGTANARIGLIPLEETLRSVAGEAIGLAGLDEADVGRIRAGMGIAGISRPGVRAALDAFRFPFASVAYDTDAHIANLGAHAGRDGAILILGTGSIAQLKVNGASFTIGGYGFPISDEGSGAALGLSAMRHALRALDGRTRSTPLSLAVSDRFGRSTVQAIAWMDRATPADYASLAPIVMDYAEHDDAIARSIVEDAAHHVERFVETIFERGAERCALVGGLAPRLQRWLRARTVERLCRPAADPLTGALYLAGLPVETVLTRP